MHIAWRKEFEVDVRLIDDQHRHFIDITNKLYNALEALDGDGRASEIIMQLREHALTHFGTEERYFDEFECEGIGVNEHRFRHREFVEELDRFEARHRAGDMDVVIAMIEFAENWLFGHIMTYDKRYVDCFHEHGLR